MILSKRAEKVVAAAIAWHGRGAIERTDGCGEKTIDEIESWLLIHGLSFEYREKGLSEAAELRNLAERLNKLAQSVMLMSHKRD